MFCRKCGTRAKAGEKYCKHCGAALEAEEGSTEEKAPALTGSWFKRAKDVVPSPVSDAVEDDLYNSSVSHTSKFYIPNDLTDTHRSRKREDPPATRRRVTPKYPAHEKSRSKRDQLFNRSPRLRVENKREQVVLQNPPSVSGKPEINWVSVLLPPIVMALLVVLVSILSGGVSVYMLIMLPMQAISIVIAVINYRKQLTKHRDISALRNSKYDKYLSGVKNKIIEAANKQLQIANAVNPAPEECVSIVMSRKKNLWERRPEDMDFGCFRVGRGQIPADVTAVWTERSITLAEDELEQKAADLGNSFKYIDNAPIVIPNNSNIIGIVGDARSTCDIARQAIVQLTAYGQGTLC